MKNKPIIAVFEYGFPDLECFKDAKINYQEWSTQTEKEIRVCFYDLDEYQKKIVLSYCSGPTIEYIQKNKPDYVIFWK